jgi:hypothetical protein
MITSCVSGERELYSILLRKDKHKFMEKSNSFNFLTLCNKLNSLQRYDILQNYRIIHRMVHICPDITSNYHTFAMLKPSSIKTVTQIKPVGMFLIVYYTSLHLCSVQQFMRCLHKRKILILTFNRPPRSYLCFFSKWFCQKLFIF